MATRDRLTSGRPKEALGDATTRSHARTNSQPPATAGPSTAAITALGAFVLGTGAAAYQYLDPKTGETPSLSSFEQKFSDNDWCDHQGDRGSYAFNKMDSSRSGQAISRISYEGPYDIDDKGFPICPDPDLAEIDTPRQLGRLGPNHAADPIIIRHKRDNKGQALQNEDGTYRFEAVLIKRKDTGEWAIPGGMIEPGDSLSATLKKEFGEEVANLYTGMDLKKNF